MTDQTAPHTSSEVETHDPRADLIRAAQQCADASAQLLQHHIEAEMEGPKYRFEGEVMDHLAEALRTACAVEQDALVGAIARSHRPFIRMKLKEESSELGQLAAACTKFLLRDGE